MCPSGQTKSEIGDYTLQQYCSGGVCIDTHATKFWAGKARASGTETCPARDLLVSSAQSVLIPAASAAQANSKASGVYALAIFRSSSVTSSYIAFAVHDATGKLLTNGNETLSVAAARRVLPGGPTSQRPGRQLLKGSSGSSSGGSSGAGGSRSGGGGGGFSSSAAGGRSYGYSSSALSGRFAGGYSRTSYGYTGRSAVLAGVAFSLMWHRPYYGGYRSDRCSHYSGSTLTKCQQHYESCYAGANSTTVCSAITTSALTRDDLLNTAFDATEVTWPLTVTFYKAVAAFKDAISEPAEWDQPMMVGLSEVDVDDDGDEFPVWAIGVIVGGVVLCVIFWCCCCYCCDTEKPCCGKDRHNVHPESSSSDSEEDEPPPTVNGLSPQETRQPTQPHMAQEVPPPPPAPIYPPWQQVAEVDAATGAGTGRFYYYNTRTGVTSCSAPLSEPAFRVPVQDPSAPPA